MPQIPDQIRPYLAALAKYHFWILAALVPLVLLPLLFQGTSKIDKEIAGRKQEIDDRCGHRREQDEQRQEDRRRQRVVEEARGPGAAHGGDRAE